ncbi:MAG: N,N-dimethylformamidase beta subunit family domain-containing protein [Mucilaginibacter sp.]
MERRLFVKKAGTLLAVSPVLASIILSCKKTTLVPKNINSNSTHTPPPDYAPPTTSGPANSGVKTLAPGEGNDILTLTNTHILNGYAGKTSYLPGSDCTLYLSADATYHHQKINVYDIRHNLAFSIPIATVGKQQIQTDMPYQKGYGYTATITFIVPNIQSGVYLIANSIPLIIKSNSSNVDFTIVYPTNTENAYCLSGGKDLYGSATPTLSFLRPIGLSPYAPGIFKWLLLQSYIYNVISDADMESMDNIKGKLLVITGHSEYWTKTARLNFDTHVNNGKPALVLSGNTMYWHARYNETGDQLICYKDPQKDPASATEDKTTYWYASSQQYPPVKSIGVDGSLGGFGIQSRKSFQGIKIADPTMLLFNGLNIKRGDVIPCSSHELDAGPIAGYDREGFPILDNSKLGFYKYHLIGYDIALDYFTPNKFNTATAVMFRKTPTSGAVINMATTNWCTNRYFTDPKNLTIPTITKNAIDGLLNDRFMV